MSSVNTYHLAEVVSGHGDDAVTKLNAVRMRLDQARRIAEFYNRVATDNQPRAVVAPCTSGMCCTPEDADITGRGLVFVDVLGRGLA